VQRGTQCSIILGRAIAFDPERTAFEDMLAPTRCFLRFGSRCSRCAPLALAVLPPFDEVLAIGKGFPVVTSLAIAGDGDELPAAIHLELFENVDARHPASAQATV